MGMLVHPMGKFREHIVADESVGIEEEKISTCGGFESWIVAFGEAPVGGVVDEFYLRESLFDRFSTSVVGVVVADDDFEGEVFGVFVD